MIYTVFNGCMTIATYKQRGAAIRRAKKQALLNLIDETESEVTVVCKQYSTARISEQVYSSYDEE